MEEALATFAEVIIPFSLPRTYTYRIPREQEQAVAPGMRVSVQFGSRKVVAGIIQSLHHTPPAGYQAKYILSLIDEAPLVTQVQLKFWEWISAYYMSAIGEVMNASLPAALKLESETKICLNPDFDIEGTELDDREYLIIEALQIKHELSIGDISEILQLKNTLGILKSLVVKEAIVMQENLEEKYKQKTQTCIRLNPIYEDDQAMHSLFDSLEKHEKRLAVVMAIISLKNQNTPISKKQVLAKSGASDAVLKTLEKKGIIEIYQVQVDRLAMDQLPTDQFELNPDQEDALGQIHAHWESLDTVLLKGVTSSGKTHVYVKLIEEQLKKGKQVLFLLPEIALTSQMVQRIRKYFGSSCQAFHSRFSDQERVEIWNKVLDGRIQLIIGARSALFLPYRDLGLVIVDEEHETSYKQQDPSPRYNARECALYLAKLHHAKSLLGSATPSFESYSNALAGRFGLVRMEKRFGDLPQPELLIADLAEENRTKQLVGNYFSSVLHQGIQACLDAGEQVILFQNRRGYAPVIECESCRWVPKCENCDISLTYHKYNDSLKCHYCGYQQKLPETCHACGSTFLNLKGFGTEKIEDELSLLFPQARILRLDLDSARSKNGHEQILNEFGEGKADILVGTQMIGKGLDFEKVSLVGIINADQLLYFPDFRAHERSYQLISQVAGRAGRKHKQGRVIIQTNSPNHPVIKHILDQSYEALYESECLERENFHYPPYFRIIRISVRHKDVRMAQEAAWRLRSRLEKTFGENILGPESPHVSKIRNYYIRELIVKIHRNNASLQQYKNFIRQQMQQVMEHPDFKRVIFAVDVDPA
ncbi:primosomal protein N' [Bacteroidota bacterium]